MPREIILPFCNVTQFIQSAFMYCFTGSSQSCNSKLLVEDLQMTTTVCLWQSGRWKIEKETWPRTQTTNKTPKTIFMQHCYLKPSLSEQEPCSSWTVCWLYFQPASQPSSQQILSAGVCQAVVQGLEMQLRTKQTKSLPLCSLHFSWRNR